MGTRARWKSATCLKTMIEMFASKALPRQTPPVDGVGTGGERPRNRPASLRRPCVVNRINDLAKKLRVLFVEFCEAGVDDLGGLQFTKDD